MALISSAFIFFDNIMIANISCEKYSDIIVLYLPNMQTLFCCLLYWMLLKCKQTKSAGMKGLGLFQISE